MRKTLLDGCCHVPTPQHHLALCRLFSTATVRMNTHRRRGVLVWLDCFAWVLLHRRQPASHHAWNLSLPYPLSGLKASCNSQGHIVSLSNPCWQPAAATSPPVLRQAVLLQVKARRKEQQRCRKGVCADEGAKQGAVGSVETVLQQALTTHQFTNFELASTVTSCLVSATPAGIQGSWPASSVAVCNSRHRWHGWPQIVPQGDNVLQGCGRGST